MQSVTSDNDNVRGGLDHIINASQGRTLEISFALILPVRRHLRELAVAKVQIRKMRDLGHRLSPARAQRSGVVRSIT
jgi:hypothetical protein